MKGLKKGWLVVAIMLGMFPRAFAMGHEVVSNDKFNLNIGGRLQLVGYGQYVTDPYMSNARVFLFLKQARLNLHGNVEGSKYNMEWVGGAEDVNGSNTGLTLLDFSFDVPWFKTENTWLRVGQFKVPYGREEINNDAEFQLVDTSILYKGFNLGRDYGLALHTVRGKMTAAAGVFTGGARDVPLRFLPERLGVPMLVARVGYNDGLDVDAFTVSQNDPNVKRTVKAAYINGMYFKDSMVGHSSVLAARTTEKNWLINGNWNPYIVRGAPVAGSPATVNHISRSDYYQFGGDLAARGLMSCGATWNTEAQLDYGRISNGYGNIEMVGARVQGGVLKKNVEVALRYSAVLPDQHFVNVFGSNLPLTGTQPIHEVAPAVSYYFRGHDMKLVADFPILVNVPVFVEKNVGTYVSTEQPDQASVTATAAKGYAERQLVPEARLMFQLAF